MIVGRGTIPSKFSANQLEVGPRQVRRPPTGVLKSVGRAPLAATVCGVLLAASLPGAATAVDASAKSGGSPARTAAASASRSKAAATPTVGEHALRGIDAAVPRVAGVAAARTGKLAAARKYTFSRPVTLVSVSADGSFATGTVVAVRVKQKGKWGKWTELGVNDGHGPDPASTESKRARFGSDPLLTTDATAAQVRVATPSGKAPRGLSLTTVVSPSSPADAKVGAGKVRASATVGQPPIYSRADWGANESWRGHAAAYTAPIKVGFVHHTASTSDYTPAETPAKIRAIYAYHTRSLKHSDIDYNFVVDRFGRLWEARYGGIDKAVEGAHTAGFNKNSFAVAALGNFMTFVPPATEWAAMQDSIARLFAWKLGLYGVNPADTAHVISLGYYKPTKYARGVTANIPAMSSHQTVNLTKCPGDQLEAAMPAIRALAASYSSVVLSPPAPSVGQLVAGSLGSITISSTATKPVNWRLDVFSPCSDDPVRTLSGAAAAAGPVTINWDLEDSAGAALLPASYTLRLTGTDAAGAAVAPVSSALTITPAPGGAWGPCGNVTRIPAETTAGRAVAFGRLAKPTATSAVLVGDPTASVAALSAAVVAAPLAHKMGVPLLVTDPAALSAEVSADLAARKVSSVTMVGGAGTISDAVAAALSAAGISVERIVGATDAATAAQVASRFGSVASAVLVDPTSGPERALGGAALAAAGNVPVLLVSASGVPAESQVALAAQRIGAVTVAVPASVSDAVLVAGLGGRAATRLGGTDAATAAAAIAAAFPTQSASAVLMSDAPATWGPAPAAAALGQPLLLNQATSLDPATQAYFRRSGLTTAVTGASAAILSDAVLGGVSRLLLGLPLPTLTTLPIARPVSPVVTAPKATTTRKLYGANAAPEPVRKGATVTVQARLTAKYNDKKWRAAPAGLSYALYFRAKGKKKYAKVRAGVTLSGLVKAKATAKKSGYWRVRVGSRYSASDYVRVK